jgi:transcriptional regulator with XRE-family HTH domain
MTGTVAHARFQKWFASLGTSQADLAKRLGCDQSVVSRLVDGSRGLSIKLAAAIERESATWGEGPIRPGEWATPNAPGGKHNCQSAYRKARKAPRNAAV